LIHRLLLSQAFAGRHFRNFEFFCACLTRLDLSFAETSWNVIRRGGAELTSISRMFWVCRGIRRVSSRIDVFAILRSAQPRGGTKIAIEAKRKTPGNITRRKSSIRFALFFFWPLSRMIVATISMREKNTSKVLVRIKASSRVMYGNNGSWLSMEKR
jgi:hypothetical protein